MQTGVRLLEAQGLSRRARDLQRRVRAVREREDPAQHRHDAEAARPQGRGRERVPALPRLDRRRRRAQGRRSAPSSPSSTRRSASLEITVTPADAEVQITATSGCPPRARSCGASRRARSRSMRRKTGYSDRRRSRARSPPAQKATVVDRARRAPDASDGHHRSDDATCSCSRARGTALAHRRARDACTSASCPKLGSAALVGATVRCHCRSSRSTQRSCSALASSATAWRRCRRHRSAVTSARTSRS